MEGVKKRARDELVLGLAAEEQPVVKRRLLYDIFDTLDDDFLAVGQPAVSELAAVMESFEREIGTADEGVEELDDVTVVEIGWLLEASDDELGLPPSTSGGNGADRKLDTPPLAESETVGDGWGFEPWEFGRGEGDGGGPAAEIFQDTQDASSVATPDAAKRRPFVGVRC